MKRLEGKFVHITNDDRFEGCIGKVLSVSYVTIDGVKKPFKVRVRIYCDDVYRSGFTKDYIQDKNLEIKGIVIVKDAWNVVIV